MKGKQIASMVCGILSVCWGCGSIFIWVVGVIGIALGIVAFVLSSGLKKAGGYNGMAKAGFICGLIGVILSAIMLIVGIACLACVSCGSWIVNQ